MTLNRIVVILTAALGLAAAVLPVVANFDWTSTAGIIAGLTAVVAVVLKWLDGWQAHEARTFDYSRPLDSHFADFDLGAIAAAPTPSPVASDPPVRSEPGPEQPSSMT